MAEKMYCDPGKKTNWKSLSEAKQKCSEDDGCYEFYDRCGNGNEYKYCSNGATSKSTGCGSILYTPGNC